MKNTYIQQGSTFRAIDTDAFGIHERLPIGTYTINETPLGFEIARIEDMAAPGKLYGDLTEKVIPNIRAELEAAEKRLHEVAVACAEAEFEAVEQARLNGAGGERELALMAKLEVAEKERDALRAKIERMTKRLRLILEEPENTMSNSKAMREMLRQARLALEKSK